MGDIVQLPTSLENLAISIRAAFKRTEQGRAEWIEGTIELAAALAEARGRFPGNREFSHWVVDAGLEDINHQDRAALISMARDIPAARRMLEETKRTSWRVIWEEEMKDCLTSPGKMTPQTPKLAVLAGENAIRKEIPTRKTGALFGLPRHEEVYAVFKHGEMRSRLGKVLRKRGNMPAWEMILTALDEGFLFENDSCITKNGKLPLRILFSSAPRIGAAASGSFLNRYDLANPRHLELVRNTIWPLAIANREAVMARPECLEALVVESQRQRQQLQQKIAVEHKMAAAVAALPKKRQDEVVVFGKRFWPRPDRENYTYDQVRAAVWYFNDCNHAYSLARAYEGSESRAIAIRFSTRWFSQYADREIDLDSRFKIKAVYNLVDAMAAALIANPDGECNYPTTPKTEGKW
jgi:hypothetical protein